MRFNTNQLIVFFYSLLFIIIITGCATNYCTEVEKMFLSCINYKQQEKYNLNHQIDAEAKSESLLPHNSLDGAMFSSRIRGKFLEIMLGNAPFQGRGIPSMYVNQLVPHNECDELGSLMQFALVDMDGDGVYEVVINDTFRNIKTILRYYNGQIYGHGLFFRRSLSWLRVDGSFLFSGGAAIYGIERLEFLYNYPYHVVIAFHNGDCSCYDTHVCHYINGNIVTRDEFLLFFDTWQNTDEVTWHEFTKENVMKFFAKHCTEVEKMFLSCINYKQQEKYDLNHQIDAEAKSESLLLHNSLDGAMFSSRIRGKFLEIMLSNAPFQGSGRGISGMYVNQFFPPNECDELGGLLAQFALVDMDGDGVYEVVINDTFLNIKIILRYYNGQIYGHGLFFRRSLSCLRVDGSFRFSGGAAVYGIERLGFLYNYRYRVVIAFYNGNCSCYDAHVCHYINGNIVTRDEFLLFFDTWQNTDEVTWHEFTKENVMKFFAK